MRFGLAADPPARRPTGIVAATTDGRSYVALREHLASAPLESGTKHEALALLAVLADAEASVHGIGIDEVHFHELADWHSLLDVVAAGFIASRLAGATWTASRPPLGGGTVKTAHGTLPVPAPATARLLVGFPWRDDGVGGERVTPTGAAILRRLVAPESYERRRPEGRLLAVGMGAGTKVMPGLANVTRALVFERSTAPASDGVGTIEFDIDDMTGEELSQAAERLRLVPGVVDVSIGHRIGKKGRPLSDFRLLVDPAAAEAVARACFAETSTLGLRIADVGRHVLRREEASVTIGDAAVGVKVAHRPHGERTAKAEHDDVRGSPSLGQRRKLRSQAERRALEDDA